MDDIRKIIVGESAPDFSLPDTSGTATQPFRADEGFDVRAHFLSRALVTLLPPPVGGAMPLGDMKIPRPRGVNPATMFVRAMTNGFRYGVNVKRNR